jgi:hypothetical protein
MVLGAAWLAGTSAVVRINAAARAIRFMAGPLDGFDRYLRYAAAQGILILGGSWQA